MLPAGAGIARSAASRRIAERAGSSRRRSRLPGSQRPTSGSSCVRSARGTGTELGTRAAGDSLSSRVTRLPPGSTRREAPKRWSGWPRWRRSRGRALLWEIGEDGTLELSQRRARRSAGGGSLAGRPRAARTRVRSGRGPDRRLSPNRGDAGPRTASARCAPAGLRAGVSPSQGELEKLAAFSVRAAQALRAGERARETSLELERPRPCSRSWARRSRSSRWRTR